MNDQLSRYIDRYVELSVEEKNIFHFFVKHKKIGKKEFLLREGDVCTSRWFVLTGCLRAYYLDRDLKEQIVHFGVENWWITDYESLSYNRPSIQFIQAIENTEVLELKGAAFDELCRKIPKVERLFRIIAERTNAAAQKRLEFMFNLSGEEMYDKFMEENAWFAQRVPQYMLASYLGFTPEFLSKVRARKV